MNPKDPPPANTGSVSLSDEEAVQQILSSTVLGLWDIVNNLTRIKPAKRSRYRVTIFGSARAKPDTLVYNEVKRVAAALAEMGCDIITGGGPGLMQAANEGAEAAGSPERNRSVGIRVQLPFEQEVNPFVEQAFEHKNVLHAIAPFRSYVRRLCGCTRRHWDRTRNDHDLAAFAGEAPRGNTANSGGQDVG